MYEPARGLHAQLPEVGHRGLDSERPDGEEGGVAEIEQSGEADDDVQSQREEGAGVGGRIDIPAVPDGRGKEQRRDGPPSIR
jgi:hypothetical protein